MITIFAFILSTIGSINWLMIGLFQYDFIAGIFGFQASILSRMFYILFGISCFVLVFKLIKGKGTIAIFSKRNKKDVQKNMDKIQEKFNIEASEELTKHQQYDQTFNSETQSQYDKNEELYDKSEDYQQDFNSHYRK